MKSTVMMLVAALGAMGLFAEMPRSEWHAKVGECALDSNVLKGTMSQLSSADKTAFLGEVNAAIAKMPGSAEAKAAKFLAANRAAVAAAGAADRGAVLAEVYATVPPESLTIINEEFAKSEFSRPATMTDAEYIDIVKATMKNIAQRTSTTESAAVRACFAGLMFIRAAGDSAAASVTDAVVEALPPESRDTAKGSWIPSALGRDGAATYDPMLASAQAGEEPSHNVVLGIAQMQIVDSMLGDLQRGKPVFETPRFPTFGNNSAGMTDPMNNGGLSSMPRDRVEDWRSPYYKGKKRGDAEPGPYWLQGI